MCEYYAVYVLTYLTNVRSSAYYEIKLLLPWNYVTVKISWVLMNCDWKGCGRISLKLFQLQVFEFVWSSSATAINMIQFGQQGINCALPAFTTAPKQIKTLFSFEPSSWAKKPSNEGVNTPPSKPEFKRAEIYNCVDLCDYVWCCSVKHKNIFTPAFYHNASTSHVGPVWIF